MGLARHFLAAAVKPLPHGNPNGPQARLGPAPDETVKARPPPPGVSGGKGPVLITTLFSNAAQRMLISVPPPTSETVGQDGTW
jgi:hypothetical protein